MVKRHLGGNWGNPLARFTAGQVVETIMRRDNSHLRDFAVTLDELPAALQWGELVNQAVVVFMRGQWQCRQ